ncbi:MAG: type II secretion system F family protein [bacterium]|nr:type II secretion system F family protein [bacterium]
MLFDVKVLNKEGAVESRRMEAVTKTALYEQVRQAGDRLVSSKELSEKWWKVLLNSVNGFVGSIKLQEKIIFARNVSAMLDAGLALSRAISIMERQTKNQKFKQILTDINEEIAKGGTFSSALAKSPQVFSSLFVSMVRAGEESGGLGQALKVVADQMEKNYLLIKKVKGAMIYPSIVVCAMLGIGILLMIYVVPSLTATFTELKVELPTSTKVIIAISDFLKNHTILFFALFVGAIVGVMALMRTEIGKRSFYYLTPRFPIVGTLVKESYAARTSRTLSSLLQSGVEIVTALSITKDVLQNSYYKEIIDEAQKEIQKGAPMSGIFIAHEEIYPILVGEMMSVGEETGALSEMLGKLAEFYEGEVDQKTKDLSTIIEPFLMLFIGAAVGFFAVAMISPTYSVMNNL